jgi:tetratricopeptide (TPR) repeat protein
MLSEYDAERPDPVTAVEIADSYQLTESWDEAGKWYNTVLAVPGVEKASPAIASQAFLGLGNIANRQDKYDQAVEYLNKSVDLAPWRTDALYVLAVAHDLKGAYNDAIAALRRILEAKQAPGQVGVDFRAAHIKATLRLLRILVEQGRMPEALAEAQHAIAAHVDRPEIFVMAGKVLLANGSLMEALKVFERSIVLTMQGNIDSYIGLCVIYRKAGRMETARQSLDSVQPFFSGMPRYWAFRKYFLSDKTGIPEKFSEQELENEWGSIRKEFFGII